MEEEQRRSRRTNNEMGVAIGVYLWQFGHTAQTFLCTHELVRRERERDLGLVKVEVLIRGRR